MLFQSKLMPLFEADKGTGGGPETGQENPETETGSGNGGNTNQIPHTLEDALAALERTSQALRQANRESAERRKKLESLEKAENDRKATELTEAQKLTAAKEKLEADLNKALEALKTANLRQAFAVAARKLDKPFASVDAEEDGFRLADLSAVEMGDNGAVTGMDDVLKVLAKSKAYLFATQPSTQTTPPNIDATRKNAGTASATDEAIAKKRQGALYSSL